MQFLADTDYKIVTKTKRRLAFALSLALIIIGIFFFLTDGLNLGIDFKGGSTFQYKFDKSVKVNDLRKKLKNIGYKNAVLQEYGAENEILIKIEMGKDRNKLKEFIKENYSNTILRREEKVGPSIGKDMKQNSFYAVFVALIGILIYISWRFEFKYSIGAIIALLHDVLITLGAFAAFQFEFDRAVLAAILMVIGYSLNDTIVVFDRIREHMRLEKPRTEEHYENVVNSAINKSLSRTIITSVTTFLVVLVLYIAGGQILHNFAFALLVGILVGTYSSIFVSSPILIEAHIKVSNK